MALIGNRSILHKSPGRFLSGTVASGDRDNFSKHGMMRGAFAVYSPLSSIPQGARPPVSWVMARTAGGLASRNEPGLTVAAAGQAWAGFPIEGSADLMLIVADAEGQLISSGQGSATFAFTVGDLLLTASINAEGSASFAINTNAPILGAEANLTGSAALAFIGSLTPYAIGQMTGSTEGGGVLTEASIANAVWESVASAHNNAGTMGEKLNGAGSAGDPWTGEIEGGETARETMRLFRAVLLGKTTITDNGDGTATVVFIGKDGTTHRVTATMAGSEREAVTVDAT